MTGDVPLRRGPRDGGHHAGGAISLLGEMALQLRLLRQAAVCGEAHLARDREMGAWAVLLRKGARELLCVPLPTEAAPALPQPGPRVAAIVRDSRGGWRLLLAGGADEEEVRVALREALAQQLLRDLGRRRALLLSLRLRRLGPDVFRPLEQRVAPPLQPLGEDVNIAAQVGALVCPPRTDQQCYQAI